MLRPDESWQSQHPAGKEPEVDVHWVQIEPGLFEEIHHSRDQEHQQANGEVVRPCSAELHVGGQRTPGEDGPEYADGDETFDTEFVEQLGVPVLDTGPIDAWPNNLCFIQDVACCSGVRAE